MDPLDMRMHPITLAFADPEQESRFCEDHVRRSVPYLRVLLVFMALMTLGLSYMTGLAVEFASWHGDDRLQDVAEYLPFGVLGVLISFALLMALSYWSPVKRRLQIVVAVVFVLGFVVDSTMTTGFGSDLLLAGAILSVMIVYFALRLRVLAAAAFAIVVTGSHLVVTGVVLDLGSAPSSDVVLGFMMNSVFLLAINVLGAFVAYQHEVLARSQFLQTDLIGRQKRRLEEALRELKETETQLIESEKQASLGRFVAGLLHEINSPLGALTSATGTIDTGLQRCQRMLDTSAAPPADPDKTRRSIAAARKLLTLQVQSAERISGLVDDLKGFVGLDAAERQPVDVQRGLDSALRLLAESISGRITIERDLPEHPVLVDCYPGQLNQVFLRLLQNAVEVLTSQGTIRISVRQDNGRAQIRIEDDGPGIPADRLGKLFDPSLIREGTRVKMNLGLPTSKRVIEKLGGELKVDSREGRGTVVTIELPALPIGELVAPGSSVDRSADAR